MWIKENAEHILSLWIQYVLITWSAPTSPVTPLFSLFILLFTVHLSLQSLTLKLLPSEFYIKLFKLLSVKPSLSQCYFNHCMKISVDRSQSSPFIHCDLQMLWLTYICQRQFHVLCTCYSCHDNIWIHIIVFRCRSPDFTVLRNPPEIFGHPMLLLCSY